MTARLAPLVAVACTLLLVSGIAVSAAEFNKLHFLTEDNPPYNYLVTGQLRGSAVDLLLQASTLLGSPVKREAIQVQPWARAYRSALEGPDKVLFSMVRTPAREPHFKWAGPIDASHYVLIGKKSRHIKIDTAEQIRGYKLGALRDDVGIAFLQALQIPPEQLILSAHVNNLAKMMEAGRLDLWAFTEVGANPSFVAIGADPEDYEVVYSLNNGELYFAFSRDVDDDLIQAFQTALDAVRMRTDITPP